MVSGLDSASGATSTGRPWWLISRSSSFLFHENDDDNYYSYFFLATELFHLQPLGYLKIGGHKLYAMIPKRVHVCMDENLNEGKKKVEYEPNIDHLYVRSLRQVV